MRHIFCALKCKSIIKIVIFGVRNVHLHFPYITTSAKHYSCRYIDTLKMRPARNDMRSIACPNWVGCLWKIYFFNKLPRHDTIKLRLSWDGSLRQLATRFVLFITFVVLSLRLHEIIYSFGRRTDLERIEKQFCCCCCCNSSAAIRSYSLVRCYSCCCIDTTFGRV